MLAARPLDDVRAGFAVLVDAAFRVGFGAVESAAGVIGSGSGAGRGRAQAGRSSVGSANRWRKIAAGSRTGGPTGAASGSAGGKPTMGASLA